MVARTVLIYQPALVGFFLPGKPASKNVSKCHPKFKKSGSYIQNDLKNFPELSTGEY